MIKAAYGKACIFFLILLVAASIDISSSEECGLNMTSLSSEGNYRFITCGGTAYYICHKSTIFGKYTDLYKYQTGSLLKIAHIWGYADLVGTMNNEILIRLYDSTFTNYVVKLSYKLYDPSSGQFHALPKALEEYCLHDDRVQIRAIDNILFAVSENDAVYYDPNADAVCPVVSQPIHHAGFGSAYLYVKCGTQAYCIYGIDGRIQRAEAPQSLPNIELRVPNTHQLYYVSETSAGCEIHQQDLMSHEDRCLTECGSAGINALMIAMDDSGCSLYYREKNSEAGCLIGRYDLTACRQDEFAFSFTGMNDDEYISGMLIIEDGMMVELHSRTGRDRVVIQPW